MPSTITVERSMARRWRSRGKGRGRGLGRFLGAAGLAAGVLGAGSVARASPFISEVYRGKSLGDQRAPLPTAVELTGVTGTDAVALAVVDPRQNKHGYVSGIFNLDLTGIGSRDTVLFTDGPWPSRGWRLQGDQVPITDNTRSMPQDMADALGREDRMLMLLDSDTLVLKGYTLVDSSHRFKTTAIANPPKDSVILKTDDHDLEPVLEDRGQVIDVSGADVLQRRGYERLAAVGNPDVFGRFNDGGQRFWLSPGRINLAPQPIPAPATAALALAGLGLLSVRRRRGE